MEGVNNNEFIQIEKLKFKSWKTRLLYFYLFKSTITLEIGFK
jgi:hypothetical protein